MIMYLLALILVAMWSPPIALAILALSGAIWLASAVITAPAEDRRRAEIDALIRDAIAAAEEADAARRTKR